MNLTFAYTVVSWKCTKIKVSLSGSFSTDELFALNAANGLFIHCHVTILLLLVALKFALWLIEKTYIQPSTTMFKNSGLKKNKITNLDCYFYHCMFELVFSKRLTFIILGVQLGREMLCLVQTLFFFLILQMFELQYVEWWL